MNGAADSREVSCKTPRGSNRSSEAQKARSVLTFVQWRARLLLPVDRRFLLFVLVALVVYDYQTPHRLSFRTSDSSAIAHERVMGWLVVPEPECSTGVAPSKVADLLLRASMLRQVLHHVATSTMVVLTSWSPCQILPDPGRLPSRIAIMVWVTSLLRSSSVQQHINHPAGTYRTAVQLLQRYAELAGTIISHATVCDQHWKLAVLGNWPTLKQYMYSRLQALLVWCGLALVSLLPSCVVGTAEHSCKRAQLAYMTGRGSMTHAAAAAAAAGYDVTDNGRAGSKSQSTTLSTAAAASMPLGSLSRSTIVRLRDALSSLLEPGSPHQLTAFLSSSSSDVEQCVCKQLSTKSGVSVKGRVRQQKCLEGTSPPRQAVRSVHNITSQDLRNKLQQIADVAMVMLAPGPQLYVNQACLTAGSTCRLQIMIADATSTDHYSCHANAAASVIGSSRCRFLVFQQQTSLLETDLDSFWTVQVTSAAGRPVHAALVLMQQQQGTLAQVLMVLPAVAAVEMQQLYVAAAAAAGKTAAGSGSKGDLPCGHVWITVSAVLSADVALLIAGTTNTPTSVADGAGATNNSRANLLPLKQSAVVEQLLVFMAHRGYWDTAKIVAKSAHAAAAAGVTAVTHKLAPRSTPTTHNPATTKLATAEMSQIQDADSQQQMSQSGGQGGSNGTTSEESTSRGDSFDSSSSGSESAGEITEDAGGSSSGGQASDGDEDGDDGGGGGDPPGGAGAAGMPNLGDIFNGMFFVHLLVMVVVLLLLYLGVLKDPFLPAVGWGNDADEAEDGR